MTLFFMYSFLPYTYDTESIYSSLETELEKVYTKKSIVTNVLHFTVPFSDILLLLSSSINIRQDKQEQE